MKTAHEIIQAAGGKALVGTAFDVLPRYVVNRASAGRLPASWFDGLERMIGEPLPRELFTFKEAAE